MNQKESRMGHSLILLQLTKFKDHTGNAISTTLIRNPVPVLPLVPGVPFAALAGKADIVTSFGL